MMRTIAFAAAAAVAAAQTQNIVQLAEATPELRDLVFAVVRGGLVDTLSGPGPFTVFAPNNNAFAALGRNIFDYVINPHNVKILDDILTYHVVSGKVLSNQLKDGQVIKTLDNALTVTAHVAGGKVQINNANVVAADNLATNGVVHIVDAVLVPSNFALPKLDIVQTAQSVATLSTLVKAVIAGNLTGALSMPNGPYTVFAPNDAAFAKIPANTLAYLLAHPRELDNVLTYHVLDRRVYAEEITNLGQERTLQGEFLIFFVNGATVSINGEANVIATDVDCTNGVVHVIDTVLIPKAAMKALNHRATSWAGRALQGGRPNIVQLAQADRDLSTLVTALTAGGLVSTLEGAGPFTVFAPANQAFDRLPTGVLDYLLKPANKKDLVEILTYHVLAGQYLAKDVTEGLQLPTVEGQNVTFHIDQRRQIFVDYAMVVRADNLASNGVVHIIDDVLLPRQAPPAHVRRY